MSKILPLLSLLFVVMLVLTGLEVAAISFSKNTGWQSKQIQQNKEEKNTFRLDPGWIRGPIWGRIDGYEFRGTDNETLLFYAKNVHYFGIGHAFNSGFYPRHWINKEITASYSFFEGIITLHFIFGKIYGLPNQ
jgi:hypothetical protein